MRYNTHMHRRSRTKSGMTMIEVLVAMGISVVVIIAVTAFQANIFKYRNSVSGTFDTVQNAQIIMKLMAKELRSVSIASDGSFGIAQAATSTITFYADTDGNGVKERIRYSLASSTLYRAVLVPTGSPLSYASGSESTTTMLRSVSNGTSTNMFTYFDSSYDGSQSALSQPVVLTNIRLVKISAILTVGGTQTPSAKTYTTQVMLRNLKDNL